MGTELISSNQDGLVFNAPFARTQDKPGSEAGTVVSYKKDANKTIPALLKEEWVPRDLEDNLQDQIGKSTVKGRFFKNDNKSTHYAIGAPKANILNGSVYICYKCFDNDRYEDNKLAKTASQYDFKIKGIQVGARFGDALAAADINGDGIDDLIVGAPLYCETVRAL